MNEEITEFGYVVISPKPGCTMTQPVPGGQPGQTQEVMCFKIGTHSAWSGAQPAYARSNPNGTSHRSIVFKSIPLLPLSRCPSTQGANS